MDEIMESKTGQLNNRSRHNNMAGPEISKFLTQAPQKLQDFFKSRFSRPIRAEGGKDLTDAISRKEHKSLDVREVNLEKQLQLWRKNPLWGDKSPEINVSVPKGTLCNLYVKFDVGLPPDAVYNIVTDPDNKKVFKNIKEVISRKVLVDEGLRQVVELDQAAIWRFLWWSGTISVHVLVDQNREDYSMRFKQVKAGFMKKFEGCWKVDPVMVDEEMCFPFKPKTLFEYDSCTGGMGRIGSTVSLEQLLQPAVVPPPPISWYVRGITVSTTEMLVKDMIAECDRIKGVFDTDQRNKDAAVKVDERRNIKDRWALQRRNARQYRKKPLYLERIRNMR
ncbi:hypothetical protein Dimus_031514 [Dionaea muscipula]